MPVYRDKAYFGINRKGFDAIMTKALGNFKLSIYSILCNKGISRKKALLEYPFSMINNIPLLTYFSYIV
jgi:hypothetical protein